MKVPKVLEKQFFKRFYYAKNSAAAAVSISHDVGYPSTWRCPTYLHSGVVTYFTTHLFHNTHMAYFTKKTHIFHNTLTSWHTSYGIFHKKKHIFHNTLIGSFRTKKFFFAKMKKWLSLFHFMIKCMFLFRTKQKNRGEKVTFFRKVLSKKALFWHFFLSKI